MFFAALAVAPFELDDFALLCDPFPFCVLDAFVCVARGFLVLGALGTVCRLAFTSPSPTSSAMALQVLDFLPLGLPCSEKTGGAAIETCFCTSATKFGLSGVGYLYSGCVFVIFVSVSCTGSEGLTSCSFGPPSSSVISEASTSAVAGSIADLASGRSSRQTMSSPQSSSESAGRSQTSGWDVQLATSYRIQAIDTRHFPPTLTPDLARKLIAPAGWCKRRAPAVGAVIAR